MPEEAVEEMKKEPVRLFLYVIITLGQQKKNRRNHDIIYFRNQTKGERDEKAGKFFLEDVAPICLGS